MSDETIRRIGRSMSSIDEAANGAARDLLSALAAGDPTQWAVVAAAVGKDGGPPKLYAGSSLFNSHATAEVLGFMQAFVATHLVQLKELSPEKYDEVVALTKIAGVEKMDCLR